LWPLGPLDVECRSGPVHDRGQWVGQLDDAERLYPQIATDPKDLDHAYRRDLKAENERQMVGMIVDVRFDPVI
jgi:hypothetical protein